MTMETEVEHPEDKIAEEQIVEYLTKNENVFFKSQQRGESDLTKQEKTEIALEIFNKSKLNFLMRFGKHLQQTHLQFFEQFTRDGDESEEINILLKGFGESLKRNAHIDIRNRRYEALKQMILEDSYFSEIEMMKRNPLLYEQLVGQYLTQEERTERDRINVNETTTLSKILMEGIERDDAQIKKQRQEEDEDEMIEDEEEIMEISDESSHSQPTCSQWGEFTEGKRPKRKQKTKRITAQEQKLLKEEFISTMYQQFLDGEDEDFDYDSVDNNDRYDNTDVREYDAEDEYFDSEEPENVNSQTKEEEESEDELDVYMSGLDRHPAVLQLSKDIQRL